MRRLLFGLVALLLVTIIAAGYYLYRVNAAQEPPAPALNASIPDAPSTQGNVTADGTITPQRHASIAFKIGGNVAEVPVKVGDVVQAGVVLVRLDDADLRNQARQADAALKVANSQLAQLEAGATEAERQAAQDALTAAQAKYNDAKAANAGSSALKEATAAVSQAKSAVARLDPSPLSVAVAQAQVDQAQAAKDSAQSALAQATLTAPFGGTVAQVNVNVGDFVGPGTPVVVFGDLSRLRVESNDVSDLDIGKVKLGQGVNVTLDALPGQIYHGTVASISPLASESRGYKVFVVWVDLKEGVESGLRWGMDSKIEISAGGAATQGQ